MNKFNFSPPSKEEKVVFGAQRPGYYAASPISDKFILGWIGFMKKQNIKRICCLLDEHHLQGYRMDLIDRYKEEFGADNVCHSPIPDFTLISSLQLSQTILPFLIRADKLQEKIVVHCSAGIGRTGQVLACWLAYKYNLSPGLACEKVIMTGRNPYEATGSNELYQNKLYEIIAEALGSV